MGFPETPTGAVAEPLLRRPPDTSTSARAPPPPIGPLGPPRARGGGSAVSRRHCSPSSALHHVRKKQRLFTQRGRGRGLQLEAREPGATRAGGGGRGAERRRGGGPDSVWEGRGAAQRQPPPPPRARLNFLYSPEKDLSPSLSRSCCRLQRGGRAKELGAGSPKQPAPRGAEANLAARPAPQPFSRGSGRGGGCGDGPCTCCRCSGTCPFLGARRTICPASPSPPPKLPTAPGPQAAAAAMLLRPFSVPRFPPPHLPTAGKVRAVSSRVLRPSEPRGPLSGQHHSRPRRQFLRPVPHSPDLLPQSTK